MSLHFGKRNLGKIVTSVRHPGGKFKERSLNPDFFRKVNNIRVDGKLWQAYGNLQLLENPFKAPVVIHRADSEHLRYRPSVNHCSNDTPSFRT